MQESEAYNNEPKKMNNSPNHYGIINTLKKLQRIFKVGIGHFPVSTENRKKPKSTQVNQHTATSKARFVTFDLGKSNHEVIHDYAGIRDCTLQNQL